MPDPCKPEGGNSTYHSRQVSMARIKQAEHPRVYNQKKKMSRDDLRRLFFISLLVGFVILFVTVLTSSLAAAGSGLHKGRCTVINYGLEEFKSNEYDKSVEMVVEKSYWKIAWLIYYNSVENNPRVQNKFNEPGYIWDKEKKLYDSREMAIGELEKYGINQVHKCSLYQKNYQDNDRVYTAEWVEWGYMMAPGYIVSIFTVLFVFTVWLGLLFYVIYDQYYRGCCDGCCNDIEKGYKDTIEKVEGKIESIKQNGVKEKYPEVKVVEKEEESTTTTSTTTTTSEDESTTFDSAINTEEEEKEAEKEAEYKEFMKYWKQRQSHLP
ncbi:MAG: hypothetical protein WD512_10960 [Candidatus Paceibacterota bacterium]